jgi:predicted ribosome quality control (RQC) complex YloA/Tae2 family protein
MEADEAQKLQEHAEHGAHESTLRPVAFTMSVLAVLVAVTTVLGHRTHTQAILFQNQATDQWNEYQAHKIRSYDTSLMEDLLRVTTISDKAAAAKIANDYAEHEKKWAEELGQQQKQAEALEQKVEQAEARADRFDLGEALLEIGLVITSVTLLTRSRIYWYLGLVFSVLGVASAASVLLLK